MHWFASTFLLSRWHVFAPTALSMRIIISLVANFFRAVKMAGLVNFVSINRKFLKTLFSYFNKILQYAI